MYDVANTYPAFVDSDAPALPHTEVLGMDSTVHSGWLCGSSSVSLYCDRSSVQEDLDHLLQEVFDGVRNEDRAAEALIRSYLEAQRFIMSLPPLVPNPEVAVDPDGEFSLDWDVGPRMNFTVSISEEGALSCAGMNGFNVYAKSFRFRGSVPAEIVSEIVRLCD